MNCNASVDYAKCKEKCGKRLACGHEYLNECHECQKLSSQISGDTNVPIERAHHGKCKVFCNASVDYAKCKEKCGHVVMNV
ncbi:uncharacterized protein OCT59_018878 [Rhizophagus irregularis]|uniref:uncharacterized protein n=1 Tax=Rhizophagus irregularis TaxID=588596 RepID=UPI00332579F9|nr:hypothetical protein OCT59_018878 [Rhizophagus irregularis]